MFLTHIHTFMQSYTYRHRHGRLQIHTNVHTGITILTRHLYPRFLLKIQMLHVRNNESLAFQLSNKRFSINWAQVGYILLKREKENPGASSPLG